MLVAVEAEEEAEAKAEAKAEKTPGVEVKAKQGFEVEAGVDFQVVKMERQAEAGQNFRASTLLPSTPSHCSSSVGKWHCLHSFAI